MDIVRCLVRVNGARTDFESPLTLADIERLIGADTVDSVMLKDGVHVMVIDDLGHPKELPMNEFATLLYWEKCGGPVDWFIAGDVVIVPDSDFARKPH